MNNTAQSPAPDTFTAIGQFGRSLGLKGDLRLYPYGNSLRYFKAPFYFVTDPDNHAPERYRITALSLRNKDYAVHIQSVDTKEEAAKFSGHDVFVRHSTLPPLNENEYYNFELKGMTLIADKTGVELGKVKEVYSFPAADALQYISKNQTMHYVPFTNNAIVKVDKTQGTILINEHFCSEIL